MPCTAAPIEFSSKKQQKIPFWFYIAYPIGEVLYQYDFRFNTKNYLHLNYPLTTENLKEITKRKVTTLVLSNGADTSILTNAHAFKHLQTCVLMNERNNAEHLKNLKNYSLKRLNIVQSKPLGKDDAIALSQLNIKELRMECGFSSPQLLASSLQNNLKELRVRGPIILSNMPELKSLSLSNTRINRSFWQNLNAPKLKVINLDHVDLESGAAVEWSRFKNLREIYMTSTSMSGEEPEKLRQNKNLIYKSSYHKKTFVYNSDAAEKYFRQGDYNKALNGYLQTVFVEPSKVGYEKLASCYELLGYDELASHYRAIAEKSEHL